MKKVLSVLIAVLMLSAAFTVAASAFVAEGYPSPSDRDYYVVVVVVDTDKGGTASSDPTTVPKGDTAELVAKPDPGYEFSGWTFEGEFEFVEGDANSAKIVIRPKGDVKFMAHFKGAGGASKDSGKVSPTTGYNTELVIALMTVVLAVSATAVVITGRRYFSAK